MKRVLMVAYHFPPMSISSGIQRTLGFARYMLEAGWQPIILTADLRAYETVSEAHVRPLPDEVIVKRAFALDTARHLALFGRYPAFLARPDRWVSWWLGAVPAGLALARKLRPAAIWSTYPIATAHLIGGTLSRLTGLPWIADFRDPMAQDDYPAEPATRAVFQRIEQRALRDAAFSVFVTEGAARMYAQRYPNTRPDRIKVIENGYDEEAFQAAEGTVERGGPLTPGAFTLLHSGIVYPSERDPTHFFAALRRLHEHALISPSRLRVRFRASGHDDQLRGLATAAGIAQYLEILPPVPYRDALAEMLRADGLLVLQAANCNDQIPAKLYEYVRAGRAVIGLADPRGDTGKALSAFGVEHVVPLDDSAAIESALRTLLAQLQGGSARLPDRSVVAGASRQGRAKRLVQLLETLG